MEIALLPYERRTLETLAVKFSLEHDLVLGFAEDLTTLARLFKFVVSCPETEFRAGRVVIMGLINHAHSLLHGGLQAVGAGNRPVWATCFRGLIEIFGACVLISERPSSTPNYLEHVSAGKLYAAAERGHAGFKEDLQRLHQIVHPASGAIYAGTTPTDEENKLAVFRFGLHPPTPAEGREGVVILANIAVFLAERFEELASNHVVLSGGKVIMDRRETG
jgi:hypothetical protein